MSEWLLRSIHVLANLRESDEYDNWTIPPDCGYCMDRYIKSEWRLMK